MKTVFTILAVVFVQLTAQSQVKNWKDLLDKTFAEFKGCNTSADKTICQSFTAKGVRSMYNINDFYAASSKTDMTPFEMLETISKSSKWTKLGMAYEGSVLSKAQDLSNAGKTVLVIYKGESPSDTHISIVLPGALQTSGSWGIKVPNVAAFFTHKPENSFVNKGLSYAYSKSMMLQLEVYSRN